MTDIPQAKSLTTFDARTLRLDRRAFLTGAAALGLAAALSVDEAEAQEISEIVFDANSSVSRFDPYRTTDWADHIVFFNLFDSPVMLNRDSTLGPGLALSWESPDPNTWVLNLRQGVTWHNGDPFSADDIIFSLGRVANPDTRTIFAGTFAGIDSVRAIDPNTVEIKTKTPDPFMPARLANYGSHVLPKRYFEEVGEEGFLQRPIGTGPYKVVSFEAGQSVVMERFDGYWNPAVFPKVTMRKVPEMSARIAALKTNEAQLITGVSPDASPQIEGGDTRAVAIPSGSAFFLPINMHAAPLNSRDVRHALSLAIDRQAIVSALLGGRAEILAEPILPGSIGADPSRAALVFDPDRARSLLQQSGYTNQEIVYETMANAYFGNDRDIGEALVAMWADVGINARLSVIEPAVRAQKNTAKAFEGLFAAFFTQQYGDAAGLMWRAMSPNGILSHYWNVPDVAGREEFNTLGPQAAQEFDAAKRAEIWKRMASIMIEEMPWILMFQSSTIYGASNKLNFAPGPSVLVDLRKEGLSAA
jgi:peptide/nickel transport system substrate-binding protein